MAFRDHCLTHNLLDFSLQVETFMRFVWTRPECRSFLLRAYRHIIADNLEEDIPVAHDLLREWVSQADSALLVMDWDAGFRSYLGADPLGAQTLSELCDQRLVLKTQLVSSHAVQALSDGLVAQSASPRQATRPPLPTAEQAAGTPWGLTVDQWHFHTDMLAYVVDEVERLLVDRRASPGEIAIVAPFVDDALRFSLVTELEQRRVPVRTHRPSRALREEPVVLCLLTLAQLGHPHWELRPPRGDVALALVQALAGLDWVRASYMSKMLYAHKDRQPQLREFGRLQAQVQQRITYVLGSGYTGLVGWLKDWSKLRAGGTVPPLDVFFSRLFDELLSRPGYGFHGQLDAAAATESLIESVRKFRWAAELADSDELGKRYIGMVERGVVAAQYLHSVTSLTNDAVFVGPAHTFLAENRPVSYQFWLNANSPTWGRRLYQPLTHPFVLTRHWPRNQAWTEEDEFQVGEDMLTRVILGLTRRCRSHIYLGFCDLNPRGREERGPLADRVQRLLRHLRRRERAEGATCNPRPKAFGQAEGADVPEVDRV
jgi:hypothetical protein